MMVIGQKIGENAKYEKNVSYKSVLELSLDAENRKIFCTILDRGGGPKTDRYNFTFIS